MNQRIVLNMYKIFVVKDIIVDVIDMMGNIHHKTVRLKKRMFFFSRRRLCSEFERKIAHVMTKKVDEMESDESKAKFQQIA